MKEKWLEYAKTHAKVVFYQYLHPSHLAKIVANETVEAPSLGYTGPSARFTIYFSFRLLFFLSM